MIEVKFGEMDVMWRDFGLKKRELTS